MIESGIYDYLQASTVLTAIAQAIYLNTTPEGAPTPSLCFRAITTNPDTTFDGPSSYVVRRYQFTCSGIDSAGQQGSGYVAAKMLQDTLRQVIDGLTLVTLADGTYVYNVIRSSELDNYDSDLNTHYAISDYYFHFRQV